MPGGGAPAMRRHVRHGAFFVSASEPASLPQLELRGIVKRYPGTLANDRVDLRIMPGELHALLGENGAGKSTLVKCIYGVVHPEAGEILWEGRPVAVRNPAVAQRLGIGMVFQHFSLFETLTVAQNVALTVKGKGNVRQLSERIREVSLQYQLTIDPDRHVYDLSVGERQRVEVVSCLLQDPKLLIMDEPTSVLAPQEVERLFETLRRLAAEGRSILYISHKLEEVRTLCERATVMRQGKVVATCDPRQESGKSLARMMIGGDVPECDHREAVAGDRVCLAVKALDHRPSDPFGTPLKGLGFELRNGEILGIAGVAGNGQKELLSLLSGEVLAERADMITLAGQPMGRIDPGRRRKLGLAFAPAERLGRGAVPDLSLAANACLTAYHNGLVRHGFMQRRAVARYAQRVCERFRVVASGVDAAAKSLSGGNLQKFVMGREILLAPKVLVAANPTWGVDVGAATVIHQALLDLAASGAGVVVLSEDLGELFEICDRITVIYEGRLSPVRVAHETDRDEIGRWMTGVAADGARNSSEDGRKGRCDAVGT